MAENVFLWKRWALLSVASLGLGLVVGGCGGGDDDTGDDDSTEATQTSPTPVPTFLGEIKLNWNDNDPVNLNFDTYAAAATYDVNYFDLQPEGNCGDARDCGRVMLKIDGDDCNQVGMAYNNVGSTGSLSALFGECADPLGTHTVTVTLIYDDGSASEATDSVTIVTDLPGAVAQIAFPNQQNSTFDQSELTNDALDVIFSVTNFDIRSAGSCENRPNCGHVYVFVDDLDGNGAPNLTVESPSTADNGAITVSVDLTKADSVTGPHTISVSLRDDAGAPYLAPDGTTNVGDSIEVGITDPSDPKITILSPAPVDVNEDGNEETPQVMFAEDGYMTIPVTFSVSNFELSMDCASLEGCGHVHVLLDDDAEATKGNGYAPDVPYNNSGVGEIDGLNRVIDARFYWLSYNGYDPTGAHSITLALHDQDHNAVSGSGIEVRSTMAINGVENDVLPFLNIVAPRADSTVTFLSVDDLTTNMSIQINDNETALAYGEPGTCVGGGGKTCIHFRGFIDDDRGNIGGQGYNAITGEIQGVAGLLTLDFGALIDNGYADSMYGAEVFHRIGVVAYTDDGAPYEISNSNGSSVELGSWRYVSLNNPADAPTGE